MADYGPTNVDGIISVEAFLDLLDDRIADHREQCRRVKERVKDPENSMSIRMALLEVKERSAKIEELEELQEMISAEDDAGNSGEDGSDN